MSVIICSNSFNSSLMFDCLIMVQCICYSWLYIPIYPRILGKSMVYSWFYPIMCIYIYTHPDVISTKCHDLNIIIIILGHIPFYPINSNPCFRVELDHVFDPSCFFTLDLQVPEIRKAIVRSSRDGGISMWIMAGCHGKNWGNSMATLW